MCWASFSSPLFGKNLFYSFIWSFRASRSWSINTTGQVGAFEGFIIWVWWAGETAPPPDPQSAMPAPGLRPEHSAHLGAFPAGLLTCGMDAHWWAGGSAHCRGLNNVRASSQQVPVASPPLPIVTVKNVCKRCQIYIPWGSKIVPTEDHWCMTHLYLGHRDPGKLLQSLLILRSGRCSAVP